MEEGLEAEIVSGKVNDVNIKSKPNICPSKDSDLTLSNAKLSEELLEVGLHI